LEEKRTAEAVNLSFCIMHYLTLERFQLCIAAFLSCISFIGNQSIGQEQNAVEGKWKKQKASL